MPTLSSWFDGVALILVAIITGVFGIISIRLQQSTHREIKSPNGKSTGETVDDIRHEQIRMKKMLTETQEDLRENTKDTAAVACAFGEHLSEVQTMSDLVAWARLHMIEDHKKGVRLPPHPKGNIPPDKSE